MQSAYPQWLWWRAGSKVSMGHIFPQGVLAALTLVGDGAEDGDARARAMCDLGFLLSSVAVTTLSGLGLGSKVLDQKP